MISTTAHIAQLPTSLASAPLPGEPPPCGMGGFMLMVITLVAYLTIPPMLTRRIARIAGWIASPERGRPALTPLPRRKPPHTTGKR